MCPALVLYAIATKIFLHENCAYFNTWKLYYDGKKAVEMGMKGKERESCWQLLYVQLNIVYWVCVCRIRRKLYILSLFVYILQTFQIFYTFFCVLSLYFSSSFFYTNWVPFRRMQYSCILLLFLLKNIIIICCCFFDIFFLISFHIIINIVCFVFTFFSVITFKSFALNWLDMIWFCHLCVTWSFKKAKNKIKGKLWAIINNVIILSEWIKATNK